MSTVLKHGFRGVTFLNNLKVEKNVAVFEGFYPVKLGLLDVKRGFSCSIPF